MVEDDIVRVGRETKSNRVPSLYVSYYLSSPCYFVDKMNPNFHLIKLFSIFSSFWVVQEKALEDQSYSVGSLMWLWPWPLDLRFRLSSLIQFYPNPR